MPLEKAKTIINDIKNGAIKPIYFLMGEEPYYIDGIASFIENNVLTEAERGFNQMVLYGRDVSIDDIVSNAKRYPMMAEKQVVIVKEAQDLSRTIENLASYANNPQPTTVLVLCYKYKKLDARKALSKAIKKTGVIFESKKLYENQVPDWIRRVLAGKGYTITPKASQMLVEFLGNDLGKVNNELEKLQLIIKPGEQITPQLIEENIGISKDFNNFELQNAIGERDIKKAYAIVQYFGQNAKNHPLVMTVALLYSFFSKVMKYHALRDKSNAAKELGISPYFLKDYKIAARNYPMKKVSAIIAAIRETDMKSKGVGAANMSQGDLLKELLVSIFN
ncbi:MAG: DNA polymerase III subunit delta [Flavobacteriales bacterium]|jgi:DNA polymerase-3 subunit delta|uniref:DNA polymerase III subunit delta n=1 Tax=Candidatus Ulvibacter alkanivorans TaxID=2267620 RepID=UPI000DF4C3D6|nr:DNA polymerase III subunit delta [Candidatus Ulvibacter alkanivorans]MCH2488648.1 DNA polymerase III subunit delta [Flavobacteriales bacterium]